MQKYPGDIDLLEEVNFCCSRKEAIDKFIVGLQEIVKNYYNKKDRFFFEIKAGFDPRFDFIDTDELGNLYIDKYNVGQLAKITNELYERNAIPQKIFDGIFDILLQYKNKDKITDECDKDNLILLFRKNYVLRWNAEEIFNKQKKLKDYNKTYTIKLQDAIDEIGKINMEGAAIVDGNIMDVSNFFVLGYTDNREGYEDYFYPITDEDKEKDFKPINRGEEEYFSIGTYILKVLYNAIMILKDSCVAQDYLKLMKRLFSLAKIIERSPGLVHLREKNHLLLDKIVPFISSDTSYLNYLKNSLSIIADLIDNNVKYFPYDAAIKQVKQVRVNLGKITIIDNIDILNQYDTALKQLVLSLENKDLKRAEELITIITENFKLVIQVNTKKYMEEVGLLPLPKWINLKTLLSE